MQLPALTLTREELSNFEDVLQKEWLITNGLGGYASSTVLGINTRKYHGLLVAALHPPGDRTVCLAKLDEQVNVGKNIYLLGANQFHGAIFPKGFIHLKEFSVSPFPKYLYTIQDVQVQKTIFMPSEKNVTITVYNIQNPTGEKVKIEVSPLLSCRHFHSIVDQSRNPLRFTQNQGNHSEVQLFFNAPKAAVTVRATEGDFQPKPNWIERLLYREDAMRGESSIDDCYQPGNFKVTVPPNSKKKFAVTATASESIEWNSEALKTIGVTMSDVDNMFNRELEQRVKLIANFYVSHPTVPVNDWLSWILLATDAFIVKTANNCKAIIAGYHWYEAWGRDTFISLPGLMLVTGRFEDAKNVLSNFNSYCKRGLIPNFLQDHSGEAAYNSVDATLWYVNAVLQYLKYTGDSEFVHNELWENLKDIIESHVEGTDFGIHMDNDGLLAHGERLTWMDTEVGGKAITPRAGKAVEVQALWYNALKTAQLLAFKFEERNLAETYAALANKVQASFSEKFWNNQRQCLFDTVAEQESDASLKPNQIIAPALDFSMLNQNKNKKIVEAVQRELSTPCGLRTLERNNPEYKGIYFGDRWTRDRAYHNGTVWPWLLGPFTKAFLKTKGYTVQNREYALKNFILPLFTQQILQRALGIINEIFDGDEPHTPGGCIAQAWSVGEPLRAYVEDVLQVRPKYEREVFAYSLFSDTPL